mgnify:CR=1 FL=1
MHILITPANVPTNLFFYNYKILILIITVQCKFFHSLLTISLLPSHAILNRGHSLGLQYYEALALTYWSKFDLEVYIRQGELDATWIQIVMISGRMVESTFPTVGLHFHHMYHTSSFYSCTRGESFINLSHTSPNLMRISLSLLYWEWICSLILTKLRRSSQSL